MKKIKKLELNKEPIANLNDVQLGNIKGGSSYPCAVTTIAFTALTWDVYQSVAGYYTWPTGNGCVKETVKDCGGGTFPPPTYKDSEYQYTGGCLLTEIVVTP